MSSQKYWPFGATRSGAISQTDKQYTGQQQEPGDSALGLYNYKARFYSTTLGRFVSADPVQDQGPQSLNRYSNVRNRPLTLTDPAGLVPACDGCLTKGTEAKCVEMVPGTGACGYIPVPSLHPLARYADLIRAQAAFWGVSPEAILAIVAAESDKGFWESIHEMNGIEAALWGGDAGFWAYARLDEPDYGIGNITVTALRELEDAGFSKIGNTVFDRIVALQNPETSIMLVAALLAHYAGMVSPLYDPQTRMEHAMLIYVAGSRAYNEKWHPGGQYIGPVRGDDGLYHPATSGSGVGDDASASVNRFLIIIDQARATLTYCETAEVC